MGHSSVQATWTLHALLSAAAGIALASRPLFDAHVEFMDTAVFAVLAFAWCAVSFRIAFAMDRGSTAAMRGSVVVFGFMGVAALAVGSLIVGSALREPSTDAYVVPFGVLTLVFGLVHTVVALERPGGSSE